MNKTTITLSQAQYEELIVTLRKGFTGLRPAPETAFALILEANLGLRIGDIVKMRRGDIIRENNRYRLDIIEEKTQKKRRFTVPAAVYDFIEDYCQTNHIAAGERIVPVTDRTIQRKLQLAADYLGYDRIGTHSFRKLYATNFYENSGKDIELTRQAMNHSNVAITQRYLGIGSPRFEEVLSLSPNLL